MLLVCLWEGFGGNSSSRWSFRWSFACSSLDTTSCKCFVTMLQYQFRLFSALCLMPAVVSLALLAKPNGTLEYVLISHLTVEQKACTCSLHHTHGKEANPEQFHSRWMRSPPLCSAIELSQQLLLHLPLTWAQGRAQGPRGRVGGSRGSEKLSTSLSFHWVMQKLSVQGDLASVMAKQKGSLWWQLGWSNLVAWKQWFSNQ